MRIGIFYEIKKIGHNSYSLSAYYRPAGARSAIDVGGEMPQHRKTGRYQKPGITIFMHISGIAPSAAISGWYS